MLKIGYAGLGNMLTFSTDVTTIDVAPSVGSNYYIGHETKVGKWAIYLKVLEIKSPDSEKFSSELKLNIIIRKYESSDDFKNMDVKLNTSWYEFRELEVA